MSRRAHDDEKHDVKAFDCVSSGQVYRDFKNAALRFLAGILDETSDFSYLSLSDRVLVGTARALYAQPLEIAWAIMMDNDMPLEIAHAVHAGMKPSEALPKTIAEAMRQRWQQSYTPWQGGATVGEAD